MGYYIRVLGMADPNIHIDELINELTSNGLKANFEFNQKESPDNWSIIGVANSDGVGLIQIERNTVVDGELGKEELEEFREEISIFIILSFLTSCFGNKSTFEQNENIQKLGTPTKLEYYKHIQGKAFQYSDIATFVITDKQELMSVMEEIKNAKNPELWKGAGWDRIKIYYTDTILNINSENRKIGISSSGNFYYLDKENFITRKNK